MLKIMLHIVGWQEKQKYNGINKIAEANRFIVRTRIAQHACGECRAP